MAGGWDAVTDQGCPERVFGGTWTMDNRNAVAGSGPLRSNPSRQEQLMSEAFQPWTVRMHESLGRAHRKI